MWTRHTEENVEDGRKWGGSVFNVLAIVLIHYFEHYGISMLLGLKSHAIICGLIGKFHGHLDEIPGNSEGFPFLYFYRRKATSNQTRALSPKVSFSLKS